jgi:poly(A) polymerase
MMRAVRLACKLGFKIEPSTWQAIRAMAEAITTVSSERIRDELLKLLTGPDRPRGLALLRDSGLLEAFMPEAQALFGAAAQKASEIFFSTARALALLRRPSAELALATLLHPAGPDAALGISRRLRLSAASAARVGELVKRQPEFDRARAMRESALKRLLGRKDAREHLELLRARSLAEGRALDEHDFCRRTWKEMQREPGAGPLLTGGDLIGMGYTPGPLFRKILDAVEDLRLERTLRTKREAVEHVRRAYPKGPAAPGEELQ